MTAIKYPIGLNLNALIKSPFNNEITERLEPQEGQGIFVTYLIAQTLTELFSVMSFSKPK